MYIYTIMASALCYINGRRNNPFLPSSIAILYQRSSSIESISYLPPRQSHHWSCRCFGTYWRSRRGTSHSGERWRFLRWREFQWASHRSPWRGSSWGWWSNCSGSKRLGLLDYTDRRQISYKGSTLRGGEQGIYQSEVTRCLSVSEE